MHRPDTSDATPRKLPDAMAPPFPARACAPFHTGGGSGAPSARCRVDQETVEVVVNSPGNDVRAGRNDARRPGPSEKTPNDAATTVRNVVLVGHSGAGKTTLVETLLVATGTISRAGSVPAGTTVSDYDE